MFTESDQKKPTVLVCVAIQTIYVFGNVDVNVPDGWKIVQDYSIPSEVRVAISLRQCRFMTDDQKICGVKHIRAVTGCNLLQAKQSWELVDKMDEEFIRNFSLHM